MPNSDLSSALQIPNIESKLGLTRENQVEVKPGPASDSPKQRAERFRPAVRIDIIPFPVRNRENTLTESSII